MYSRGRKGDIRIRTLIGLFVVPFERPPTVKVVPSIVESFDFLLGSIVSTESRHGLGLGEPSLSSKDGCDGLAVFLGGDGLEVGNFILNVPIDRVELTSSVGVSQCLVGYSSATYSSCNGRLTLLDTLEETIITGSTTTSSLLIRVVSEHLPSVYGLAVSRVDRPSQLTSNPNVILGSLVPQVTKTKDSIMILLLPFLGVIGQ